MSVLVSPSDSQVISGGPGDRRRLLDVMLSLTDPDYLAALQKYRAALMRRNAVLRDTARNGGGDAQIAIWEPAMAECGSIIWRKRSQWCARAAPELRRLCRLMGETGEAWLAHVLHAGGASPDVTELSRALEAHRTIDMRSGRSGIGPHRDDLRITLDGSEFRQFGSGGQIRTAAVALRLLETYTIRTRQERWPVLLLDDPFAELDSERAERILALVESSGHGQVILAVPRNEDVPEGFSGLARWRVRAGTVEGDRIG
jgi:DNA replication and repair protein RecF